MYNVMNVQCNENFTVVTCSGELLWHCGGDVDVCDGAATYPLSLHLVAGQGDDVLLGEHADMTMGRSVQPA